MGKDNKETEKTCFVIMPISDHPNYPKGHFTKIYEQIFQPAIKSAGYLPKRVDEDKISSDIMAKILEFVVNSEMAICDLSSRNPNVMYELGLRHAYGKPVVLICDDKTERIFDVAGINTVAYKSERLYEDVVSARQEIENAIISTEKEPYSMLSIAQMHTAKENVSNINDDDYIKIMLSSIMKEIEYIKQVNCVSEGVRDEEQLKLISYVRKKLNFIHTSIENSSKLSEEEVEKFKDDLITVWEEINNSKLHYALKYKLTDEIKSLIMEIS